MLRKAGILSVFLVALVMTAAIYILLVPPASAPLPEQEQRYVIRNVRILDVETGSFGPLNSIAIEDGLIADIGTQLEGGRGRIVDAGGGFLVPGFWDMHMHSFQLSPQLHFPLFVANGVLNARDMMDCPEVTDSLIACINDKRRWSLEVAAGELTAPRFVAVSSFYFERPDMTPGEVRKRARLYVERGSDSLKVYNRLSPAAYHALSQSAKQLDVRLVGHLPKQVGIDDALAAGQDSFEHAHLLLQQCFEGTKDWRAGRLDNLAATVLAERMVREHDRVRCQEILEAMREAGAWLVPTHVTREEDARAADTAFMDDPRLDYLDPLSRWAFRDDQGATVGRYPGARGKHALEAYFARGLELTGAAHRAQVGVLVGTDTAIGGFRYHDELAHLVRAGLSPAAVLRAATIDAARYAKLDSRSGSIAIGKRADLVLLTANPLENIENTRSIEAVWLAGRRYDRKRLDTLLQFTKDQAASPANWFRLMWGFARSAVSGEL